MSIITIPFFYKVPDSYLSGTFDKNLTNMWEYVGDDKLWVQVDIETNETIIGATLDETMITDGRPRPRNVRYVEVNAYDDTLVAYLARPPGAEESSTDLSLSEREFDYVCPPVEGYDEYIYFKPMSPRDVYKENLIFDVYTKRLHPQPVTIQDLAGLNPDDDFSWDDLRYYRDMALRSSDSMLSPDMPDELKSQIMYYRIMLRDITKNLKDYTPWQAYNMMPKPPKI